MTNTEKWRRWASHPENAARLRAKDDARRAGLRFLSDLCKAAPCADCGQRFPAVAMDWDHRPDETKASDVSRLVVSSRSSARKLFAEIAKCDLVCSNCHRVRTWARQQKD